MSEDSLLNVPFKGSNGAGEVETLEEFLLELRQWRREGGGAAPSEKMSFDGWTFTDIDFRGCDPEALALWEEDRLDFKGAVFYGCRFPTSDDAMRDRGARVLQQLDYVPFKTMRSFMYTQDELEAVDAASYKFYLEENSLQARLAMQVHDHFMQDALFDYLEGKSVVSIMGGHQLARTHPAYRDVALMAHRLAKKGFLVASGGGPGAMEACNLGAYMFQHSEKELDDAIATIVANQDPNVEFEYQDRMGPAAVVTKHGKPTFQPSLAIPTWKYGHEPTNMFGTWICKLFSNAIREDGLLDISNAGIIYTPGSAGTRQEIFQAACGNHYAPNGKEKPTIFYGTDFWNKTTIPQVLCNVSQGRPFASWIVTSDDVDEIVEKLVQFREENHLPVLSPEQLRSKFWIRQELRDAKGEEEEGFGEAAESTTAACDAGMRASRRQNRNERVRRQSVRATDTMETQDLL